MYGKYLVAFLILCYCKVLFGQTEFAPIGAEWYFGYGYGITGVGYEHFFVEKDTVYLEKECRKINVTNIIIIVKSMKNTHFFFTKKMKEYSIHIMMIFIFFMILT